MAEKRPALLGAPSFTRTATNSSIDVSCVIHEVVSFLCSEDLLTYLSVFRKESALYKSICNGFSGVILLPLIRARCEPTPEGEHNIVVRRRALPVRLASFPHMQELLIDIPPLPTKVGPTTFIHNLMREVRATLLCGHLRGLKRLVVRNVLLDPAHSGAMQTDLAAILREPSLQSLEFVELDMQEVRPDEDGEHEEDVAVPVIRRYSLARDVLEALAQLPRLRDFNVRFGPELYLSSVFMRRRWPSLTVLRSNFLLRPLSLSQECFKHYWALGNFPSATTLVVGEWRSADVPHRWDLLSDLPTECGMKQITTLVLTGRVLKNPLLNYRSSLLANALTPQEQRRGGGGAIPLPIFHNVQTLDISRLFVPVAFALYDVVHMPGFDNYEEYADAFRANTSRAVHNITAALQLSANTASSLPTLVLSDAFFGADGLALESNEVIRAALTDCLEGLRPAKLVLDKLELHHEDNVHRGQEVFLDCSPGGLRATVENLGCGLRRVEDNHNVGYAEPLDGLSLFRLLRATPGLHACVSELELDCAFLFSRASMLELIFKFPKHDDWLEDFFESREMGNEEEEEENAEAKELFAEPSFWQFHEKVMSISDAARGRILTTISTGVFVSVSDMGAALRPFHALRRIVVNNERLLESCPLEGAADLQMLCRLPPSGCESLEVRGVYSAAEVSDFTKHVWEPLLAERRARKIFQYFPPSSRDEKWVEGSFLLTATSHGGANRTTAQVRCFHKRGAACSDS